MHSRHHLSMLRHRLQVHQWSMAFHYSITASVRICMVWNGHGRCETSHCSMSYRWSIECKLGIEVASTWHRFLRDPGLAVCAQIVSCSSENSVPQPLQKVLQLAGGVHFNTAQLSEHLCQWLAHPYSHPEKCCPKPLRTHLWVSHSPWCCTRCNTLQAFYTPLHVNHM